jgi:DNA-directed RNA polymerase subunit RPC12/RpoP
MQLKCTKCSKIINIPEERLPKDKERAMVKCPSCQNVIVFNIPVSLQKIESRPDKTIISVASVKSRKKNPRLVNDSGQTEFKLKSNKNIIGRDADISIQGDSYISRKHCLIEVIEKQNEVLYVLTDDGSINESGTPSTNGTFHNGARLSKYDKIYLESNDKIRVGRTELTFLND